MTGRNGKWLIVACLLWPLVVCAAEPAPDSPAKQAAPPTIQKHDSAPGELHPDPAKATDAQPEKNGAPAKPGASKKSAGEENSDDPTLGEAKPEPLVGGSPLSDGKGDDGNYDLYKALADTLDQVQRNYVKPVDRRELMEAAIKGIISKLDPYSSYISPDELTNFRTSVESQFGGVGIQVTIDDGQLKVIGPLVGTPAYRAGVQAGDKISKIEGEPVHTITLDEATRKLKGEPGTSVTFTVQHPITGASETFTLKRELIHLDTVMGSHRKPDDSWEFMLDPEKRIGYIRVTAFSRDTAADLRKAMEDLQARKLRGLVLDLRFNPGGLLTSAVEVCNLFISDGRIVSTKGRNTPERVWDAVKGSSFEGFPMVVLVNHYSASASEIVSACLQDHSRAAVVGDRTWGKGSVQNLIELESGKSALKLTTSSYARPNGHKIHRFPDDKEADEWGVKPDKGLDVKLTNPEMAELIADFRERDVVEGKHHEKSDELTAKLDASAKESHAAPNEDKPAATPSASGIKEKPAQVKAAKSTETKSPPQKSADAAAGAAHNRKPSAADNSPKFVDRQLQKAVEYLSSEMARAQ